MSFPLVVALSGESGMTYIGTVWGEETVSHELLSDQNLGESLFPVMKGEQMLGIISAAEMIKLVTHSQGVWQSCEGLKPTSVQLGSGVLGKLADVVESIGSPLQAIYPLGQKQRQAEKDCSELPVIFRFHADAVWGDVNTMEATGIPDSEPIRVPSLSLADRPRR